MPFKSSVTYRPGQRALTPKYCVEDTRGASVTLREFHWYFPTPVSLLKYQPPVALDSSFNEGKRESKHEQHWRRRRAEEEDGFIEQSSKRAQGQALHHPALPFHASVLSWDWLTHWLLCWSFFILCFDLQRFRAPCKSPATMGWNFGQHIVLLICTYKSVVL